MPISQRAELSPAPAPLVLIVDGDPDTRTMYAEHLASAGWTTDQAEDGREALAKAISRHPAVVVTETRLAFIDGYELCRFLRRGDDTAAMSLIVLTADGYPASVTRAQQAGAETVLVKPCLPEQLELEIRKVTRAGPSAREWRPADSGANGDAPRDAASGPRRSLVRTHLRHTTNTPTLPPPVLLCPSCDHPLAYERSHIGGVSERHPEQWDDFVCASCGAFQYRHRTRKLRRA